MKNDELNKIFSAVNLDVAQPPAGHQDRFRNKLEKVRVQHDKRVKLVKLWPSLIGLAAILLVAILMFPNLLVPAQPLKRDLASVSDEMQHTQNFYTSIIQRELQSLQDVRTPETDRMIQDALAQLATLEKDYESLKSDLVHSGNDQRVIYAMVSNFQKRMDLLNKLIEKAQNTNDYNPASHENDYL